MQALCACLSDSDVSLPKFSPVAVGKVMTLLGDKQCNIALFRELYMNINSLLSAHAQQGLRLCSRSPRGKWADELPLPIEWTNRFFLSSGKRWVSKEFASANPVLQWSIDLSTATYWRLEENPGAHPDYGQLGRGWCRIRWESNLCGVLLLFLTIFYF